MEEEVVGSAEGEPFDLDDILDLHDQCEKLKFARAILGDDWVRTNLHGEPDLMEADLQERRQEAREKLQALAST